MPEFKKDTKGFKMKGWSPFTKLVKKMGKPQKKTPVAADIMPRIGREARKEYLPQSTNPRREYIPQTQRGKLAKAAVSGAIMGEALEHYGKVRKKKSPMKKATDPTKKKPTAKVKSDKMQEANAEERAIMKKMAIIEGKMKGMDKNSSEYKKLMDKHRNLDNKLYPFD